MLVPFQGFLSESQSARLELFGDPPKSDIATFDHEDEPEDLHKDSRHRHSLASDGFRILAFGIECATLLAMAFEVRVFDFDFACVRVTFHVVVGSPPPGLESHGVFWQSRTGRWHKWI